MDKEEFHLTSKSLKKSRVEKLLSEEYDHKPISKEDREDIAHELCCESILELTFRVLCNKLWLSVKPSELTILSESEIDFLNKVFPRNKVGRPATGAGEAPVMAYLFYNLVRSEHTSDISARKETINFVNKACSYTFHNDESVRKSIERGKKAFGNQDSINIGHNDTDDKQREIDLLLVKAAQEEYFSPSLLKVFDFI